VQQGEETVDYLPVGVPFWAIVGAIIGALAAGLLLRVLRRWIDRFG
jgi:predicted membrane protein